jgi:hypothetical protein
MNLPRLCGVARAFLLAVSPISLLLIAQGQEAEKVLPEISITNTSADHVKEGDDWFLRGRLVPGKSAAELRHGAHQTKMRARAARLARAGIAHPNSQPLPSSGAWVPLGPVPLASNPSGASSGPDYYQVSGRATAVAIDPADSTGNTLYIGGAQGGVWKSTNAATSTANNVTWSALTDDQATLSIGAIAIQPGNSEATSVVLVGTGEADDSADSYFGLGIMRYTAADDTWTLISTASSSAGTLSFSGLGATRMAFSTATGETSTVVAAMAASTEGLTDAAFTGSTYPGLYTSTDAGQTWTYDTLSSGGASEATSATSVVYNAAAGLFFAVLRYQGFYSSPDGLTWTLLTSQPGTPGLLSTTVCPQNYSTSCPIYRGEITVVPGRNEMYVWFVSPDSNNSPVDQGIWQSLNGGASWTQISDTGVTDCGDLSGCGVEQGFYNLELLAVPNCPNGTQTCTGNPTDLYAGAINLYKCSITSINPTCSDTAFTNLTHAYGCDPLAAPAHVHPDQHALAFSIPNAGSSSASDLMYFANDGGIYRALDGFTGLTTGLCSSTNQFDDLNQNLGSMTQFVSFSQPETDPGTLLGGTQGNGSPATATATIGTSLAWGNVLSGDGAYNAIDPNTGAWFASNPDFPPSSGDLNIQECLSGVSCNDSLFNVVVSSSDLGGDDGPFYFPYILDPQSKTSMLVGTCRVWSGPRSGGAFTLLSLNFDTLGTGTCAGTEVNTVRALAAGGIAGPNGSHVLYATTDGPGPNNLTSPVGGNVWVTINAAAVTGVSSSFSNVTQNGPGGVSINPNQFPISSVAIDTSDTTGNTAYVTVMGFTGGPGHVWQTTNAGGAWTDFTGTAANALPDDPVNAVVVDPVAHIVYVGTDVGVFETLSSNAAWTEVGPTPSPLATGFLPNVAVTALAIFNSGCQKLLRASTYGRGVWQFDLPSTSNSPDFCFSEPGPFPTVNAGSTTTKGPISVASVNGFTGAVNLTCSVTSGSGSCSLSPTSVQLFPTSVEVTVNAANLTAGSDQLSVQGTSGSTVNTLAVPFNVADFQLSGTQSLTVNAGAQGTASLMITPSTFYAGSINTSCNASALASATCTVSPANPISVNAASSVPLVATIKMPTAVAGVFNVTFSAQDTSGNPNHSLTIAVTVPSSTADSFQLASTQAFPHTVDAGSQTSAKVSITANYGGSVNATCDASALSGQCSVTPGNPVPISAKTAAALTLTLNVPNSAAPQPSNSYSIKAIVTDSSGQPSQTLTLPLTVIQDFAISSLTPVTQTVTPGESANYNFSVLPVGASFVNAVSLSCSGAPAPLCNFTPNPVTPGNTSAAVVMQINTASSSASFSRRGRTGAAISYALWLALPGFALVGAYRRNRLRLALSIFLPFLLALLLPSCGGGGSNGGSSSGAQQQGTIPGTYTITVTGASGSLSHEASSAATLVVNQ